MSRPEIKAAKRPSQGVEFLGGRPNLVCNISKDEKNTWLFRGCVEDELYGDYFINHEMRIPIKQPCVNGKNNL